MFIPPHEGPAVMHNKGIETANAPSDQLYDLSEDIGQIRNIAPERPEVVKRMQARLQEILDGDRTRPPG